MSRLVFTLKLFSPVFLAIAALHLLLGFDAEALLGATVSAELAAESSLDSQNRFYGVAFALYGVVLYVCATDLSRFEPIFKAWLVVFFLGGVARLVSWATHGAPAPLIVFLAASELLIPPALWLWYTRTKGSARSGQPWQKRGSRG